MLTPLDDESLLAHVWQQLDGDPALLDGVQLMGPTQVLPSEFDVTGLATASCAAATLAAAEFVGFRRGDTPPGVTVDRRMASAAFVSDALFAPHGWTLPPVWDAIAGDYETNDGWIRLHTNYAGHRRAAETIIGSSGEREVVASEVQRWSADELAAAIVSAGGCAAAMNDRASWLGSAPGATTANEPLMHQHTTIGQHTGVGPALSDIGHGSRPFAGIRVLDLTRVLAGPTCTRFLAGYGADVLRIDPVGFREVPSVLPDTTVGKRCTELDLSADHDRRVFARLVSEAHVVVSGLRADALSALGFSHEELMALNPGLITASLNAYGWDSPWRNRRGFDSLVQMSCGIADAGARAASRNAPLPLPAQALDYATGYLLAAAVGRALTRTLSNGHTTRIHTSLIATANLLYQLPTPGGIANPSPAWTAADTFETTTEWGPARRVPLPGSIAGMAASWDLEAGPLGRHEPAWADK